MILLERKVPYLVRVDVQHVVGNGGEVAVLLRRLEHPLQLFQLLLEGCAALRCTTPRAGFRLHVSTAWLADIDWRSKGCKHRSSSAEDVRRVRRRETSYLVWLP